MTSTNDSARDDRKSAALAAQQITMREGGREAGKVHAPRRRE